MQLSAVMTELGANLERIDGLRVFDYVADRVTPPAAVVGWPDPIDYDQSLARGMDQQTFPVLVIVGRVDPRSARDALAPYLDGSGPSSVKAILDDGSYTACDSVRVLKASVEQISIAGTEFLAARFDVEVTGRGA